MIYWNVLSSSECSNECDLTALLSENQLSARNSLLREQIQENPRLNGDVSWVGFEFTHWRSWIQADFERTFHVYKIATQGHHDADMWVTVYRLASRIYSTETSWNYILSSNTGWIRHFQGNTDRNSVVENTFSPRVARFVRMFPFGSNNGIAVRWALYGCLFGIPCPELPAANNDITYSLSVLGGSQATVSCDEGYFLGETDEASERTTHCLHTGGWDNTPTCMRKLH